MNFEAIQLAGFSSPAPAIKEGMLARSVQVTGQETPAELAYFAQQDAQDTMALIAASNQCKALEAMAQGAEERDRKKQQANV